MKSKSRWVGQLFETAGVAGVGWLHFRKSKPSPSLVTFQKTEKEFSPTTMYQDYPISRELLHWETQAQTTRAVNQGGTYPSRSTRLHDAIFCSLSKESQRHDRSFHVSRTC